MNENTKGNEQDSKKFLNKIGTKIADDENTQNVNISNRVKFFVIIK
jgi:hypothetical protein